MNFSNKCDQFFNAGESTYGKAGMWAGIVIKKLAMVSVISVFAIAVVSISQLTQYSASVDSIRELKLSEWESKGEVYKQQIVNFKSNCRNNTIRNFDQLREAPLSIYDCATEHGSKEFSEMLKRSTDFIAVSAPLKWF